MTSGWRRLADTVPRLDRSRPAPQLDTGLPTVVLWATRFPLQHGCLGVFRSLGRAGVPVYAVVGNPRAPIARSRYVRGHILWQPHLGDDSSQLIARLIAFGRGLGRRSLIVCTSDDVAVLVARHRAELEEWFVLPDVAPRLPAELADKHTFSELCHLHGVSVPWSAPVDTMAQLEAILDEVDPPVAVKSIALRGQVQSVENVEFPQTRAALLEMAKTWVEPFQVLVQEYLPDDQSEDWLVDGYCDADAVAKVLFTGRKVRTWPVRGGATAAAFTTANPELVTLTAAFCKQIGYRGIFDIDWRRDLRTGRYYMLDFNPRVGAQFRLFENDDGIDVVRAMHLDLSGRAVPGGPQPEGERFVVEPWDMASLLSGSRRPLAWMGGVGRPRMAWLAGDDPLPVLATALTQIRLSIVARLQRLSDARA